MSMQVVAQTFLGYDALAWTGIAAISSVVYTTGTLVGLYVIFRQVRIGARSFQLDSLQTMQSHIDLMKEDRRLFMMHLPVELIAMPEQFSNVPPGKRVIQGLSDQDQFGLELTTEQRNALSALALEAREAAVRIIGRLNDIGQLVEDGYIEKRVFLGKYHVMILQLCHCLEVVRRDEEEKRTGNYGQRLLRMRQWAMNYNDTWPKHRLTSVAIRVGDVFVPVYRSPRGSWAQRVRWWLLGKLERY